MLKKIIMVIFIGIILFVIYLHIDLNKNKIDFKEVVIDIKEKENNKVIVDNPNDLIKALEDDKINIIEITKDLDLGYNKINYKGKIIEKHNDALTHPILKEAGVSKLKIKNKENLVIYSKNGSRLLHTNIRIINSKNIKIDNLKMEELWEWDEESKAGYSINDWDYITIQNSENIQISHMEFSKCYDGITDIKDSKNVTIEYSEVNELDKDDYFFHMQFVELEKNIDQYPMYKYLRKEMNFSIDKIKELSRFHVKVHLIGPIDYQGHNENIILHDNMYIHVKTRIPYARNSSVYLYNIYFDASKVNYGLITNRENLIIRKKYPRIVALDAYGPISLQRSYVLVENSLFIGVKYHYMTSKGLSIRSLGKVIMKEDKNITKNLKERLEKISGNKVYD